MDFLMESNGLLVVCVHLIYAPLFNMEVMCFTYLEKFGINLLTKFILPKKY